MSPEPGPRFVVVPLDTSLHDRRRFDCGEPSLDTYIRRQAGQDMRRKANAVFVLTPANELRRVAGFYALCGVGVDPASVPKAVAKKLSRVPQTSATLLSRLAIAKPYQRQGWGAILLVDALRRAHRASAEVGSVMVVTDPVDASAEAFYQRFGFQKLRGLERMFLPMATVARLL